jgi:hypothetical protein
MTTVQYIHLGLGDDDNMSHEDIDNNFFLVYDVKLQF